MKEFFIDLVGGQLSVRLPKGNVSELPDFGPPAAINIYDDSIYVRPRDSGLITALPVGRILAKRVWGVSDGPIIFRKNLGFVEFTVQVFKLDNHEGFFSCFNPKNMEQVVKRHLYLAYGPPNESGHRYRAPINWKPVEFDGCEGVYLEAVREDSHELQRTSSNTIKACHHFLALESSHYLDIGFHLLGSKRPVNYECRAQLIMSKIITSVKLTLSNVAREQKRLIKSQWPDLALPSFVPVEAWVYPNAQWHHETLAQRIEKCGAQIPEI